MIVIDKTVVSTDVEKEFFVCDLEKCKGACCVEGDLGAPLEEEELDQLDNAVRHIRPYLSEASNKVLDEEGSYIIDEEGDYSTTTIGGKECTFAFYDDRGILKCGVEQAWKDGKTDFRKPISCHLYPIRITKLDEYEALNYDRWSICSPACGNGASLGVPLYKFVKEPLIRKYGADWYAELTEKIAEKEKE
ncbi:MAG: hypothetical protein ACI8QD_000848 [Cyclobacteriaceae bacterium]|jgi:hypothetical protein